ncbi:aminotransferase class V-fold PLP-dependent enzyme [Clostridium paraputrificum]|uniref:aminotransferase class V-fold PLP-dependent enzyme n=1 Tax=Clostridium paraputrificum TaxID=29363 RepID=UPI003D32D28A
MDVYLDNASTTFPKPKIVADSIYDYLINIGGNANRSNYSNSLESNRQLLLARERISQFFNYDKCENVIFTNNITTSLNLLIKGLLKSGDHVISSSMEHNSVLRPLIDCKEILNIELDIIQASTEGFIDPNDIKGKVKSNTRAVIISHASNVTGSIQNLKLIGEICREFDVFFIIDTAQTAGVIDIDMKSLKADAIAFTGHKSLLGPQGVGGFIIDDKLNDSCSSILSGGTGSLSHSLYQPTFLPDKFECGTLNMPGIIGLSNAINYINIIGRNTIEDKNKLLRGILLNGMLNIDGITVYGDTNNNNSTTCISFNYKDIDPSETSFYLDSNGIKNRAGLHCAPLAHKSIHTFPTGTVRLSIGFFNTKEEIDYTLTVLNKIGKNLI